MDAEKVPAIILHKRKAHKKKKRSRKRQCLAQQNTQEHESDIGIVDNVQETATFDSLTSTIQIIKSEQVPEVKEKREKSLFPVKELVECHQCKSLSCSGDCDITITNHTGLRCRKCFIKLCKDDQFSFNNEIIKIPKEMSKNFVILGDRVNFLLILFSLFV